MPPFTKKKGPVKILLAGAFHKGRAMGGIILFPICLNYGQKNDFRQVRTLYHLARLLNLTKSSATARP